jgi:DNA-binding MarR family transcriptional regulator
MAGSTASLAADRTLDRDAALLYDALSELLRIYQFRDRDRICCHDISVTQCYALESLVREGPLTQNELASRLYLDKSTVSRVVRALEGKGLLRRVPHAEDARAVQLGVTRKGRQLYERIAKEIQEQEKRLLADFAPDVRTAMIELVGRLARAAEERVDTSGGTCCMVE